MIPGVIDEGWHDDAVARARKLYPNQGVQPVATLMARTHRYAIDYLEQAPAILSFVTWGGSCRRYDERALVAQRFGSAVHRGGKLKTLMASFNAPLPIRKLSGAAVIPSNMATIIAMRKIPPSDLAQAIPEEKSDQVKWVRLLREWLSLYGRYPYMKDFDAIYRWVALAGAEAIQDGMPHPGDSARTILDFMWRGRRQFNPEWTYRGAIRAADDWHRELAEKQENEAFLERHGFAFTDECSYAPLPDQQETGGYSFVALKSGYDLFMEGKAMRHCVASYVRDVMLGGTRIYSIRQGEDRVATMELRPIGSRFSMSQLKGHCNRRPSKAIANAAADFLRESNRSIGDAHA